MRVLANEIKKIWNWKALVILTVVCALFYTMFMEFYISYYKNGGPSTTDIEYCEELTRLYGNTITDEEFKDFAESERKKLTVEAENFIQTMPVFAAAGIYSYADFAELRDAVREETQEESDAHWTLFGEECDYLGFKIQSIEDFERDVEHLPNLVSSREYLEYWNTFSEREKLRLTEIVQNGEHHAVLSYWTYNSTVKYAVYFSILLMLSVLILVSPLLTSDRQGKLHYLQYTSKLGRKIVYSQLIVTLLSAFALTTLMILIFGSIYSVNGTYLFWNASVNSNFNSGVYSVFSLTYGQWVLAMIAIMYTLALGAAMMAFVLSRYSSSLITLVMKLIPAFVVLLFLCDAIFNGLFIMGNALDRFTQIFGTETYICGIVGVVGFIVALFVTRREKRVDVA